ncbi:MAG: tRNA dimethylallyltransferase [Crocinitomicaceae bacterium]|nr:tRNA dimethylallyltransferase [Crocinitomicaceae bacterium]
MAIALAKKFSTVILSADSRQFYKEMAIGTAKPSGEEQEGIRHYFIDSHSLNDSVTAASYEKEALEVLLKEFQQHNTIILVGGSGMFISALCDGLDPVPSSVELREELNREVEQFGLLNLLEELQHADPEYYGQVDRENPVRVIRAIEAIRLSGKTYSELRRGQKQERFFSSGRFVIDLPREVLYDRINRRVDLMFEAGLLKEAESLKAYRDLQALNTVGYKELFDYFDGKISLEDAKDLVKQNTRRYAKRQLTWFRRDAGAHWLKGTDTESQLREVMGFYAESWK